MYAAGWSMKFENIWFAKKQKILNQAYYQWLCKIYVHRFPPWFLYNNFLLEIIFNLLVQYYKILNNNTIALYYPAHIEYY